MQSLEGSISDFLKIYIKGNSGLDLLKTKATKEQFDEFFDEFGFVCVRYPENMCLYNYVSFNKKDNPGRVRYARIDDFYKNPNKKYKIDHTYEKHNGMIPSKSDIDNKKEADRLNKENELRESMRAEECELISNYTKSKDDVYYLFDSNEYKTTPSKWYAGHRAHRVKCIRYTHNYVKKVFDDAECKLLTEYKNQKTKLRYEYDSKEYNVTFNDWLHYNSRPHLGRKRTFFTET